MDDDFPLAMGEHLDNLAAMFLAPRRNRGEADDDYRRRIAPYVLRPPFCRLIGETDEELRTRIREHVARQDGEHAMAAARGIAEGR